MKNFHRKWLWTGLSVVTLATVVQACNSQTDGDTGTSAEFGKADHDSPKLPPENVTVAVRNSRELVLARQDGVTQVVLDQVSAGVIAEPRFSPTGKWISYRKYDANGVASLWVIPSKPGAVPQQVMHRNRANVTVSDGYTWDFDQVLWVSDERVIFNTKQSCKPNAMGECYMHAPYGDGWQADWQCADEHCQTAKNVRSFLFKSAGKGGYFTIDASGRYLAVSRAGRWSGTGDAHRAEIKIHDLWKWNTSQKTWEIVTVYRYDQLFYDGTGVPALDQRVQWISNPTRGNQLMVAVPKVDTFVGYDTTMAEETWWSASYRLMALTAKPNTTATTTTTIDLNTSIADAYVRGTVIARDGYIQAQPNKWSPDGQYFSYLGIASSTCKASNDGGYDALYISLLNSSNQYAKLQCAQALSFQPSQGVTTEFLGWSPGGSYYLEGAAINSLSAHWAADGNNGAYLLNGNTNYTTVALIKPNNGPNYDAGKITRNFNQFRWVKRTQNASYVIATNTSAGGQLTLSLAQAGKNTAPTPIISGINLFDVVSFGQLTKTMNFDAGWMSWPVDYFTCKVGKWRCTSSANGQTMYFDKETCTNKPNEPTNDQFCPATGARQRCQDGWYANGLVQGC